MSNPLHIVCPHCHSTNRVPPDRLAQQPQCGKCRQPLFNGSPLVLDHNSFSKHISHSDIPVLVDFWAPWCGPCKMMAPVFQQAASQLEPQFRLAKVDTEAQQQLAGQFQIRSIPTLIMYQHGQEVARQPGAMELNNLVNWAHQHG